MNSVLTTPKQLVDVAGEPNVLRTVRMLHELTSRALVTIAAPKTSLWESIARDAHAILKEPTTPLFLESAFAALPRFPLHVVDRYLVLCGDTVFSHDALRALVQPNNTQALTFCARYVPHMFTGRDSGELYGFSFEAASYGQVVYYVRECLERLKRLTQELSQVTTDPEIIGAVRERNCYLWYFMHVLEDLNFAHVHDVAVDDYTDDIDSPQDLANLPKIIAAMQLQAQVLEGAL